MRPYPILALLLLAGCAGGPRTYSTPAPAGALACALDRAAALGFTPIAGGVSDGYVRMTRPTSWTGGDVGREVATRYLTLGMAGSGHVAEDVALWTQGDGGLRLQLTGIQKGGKQGAPSSRADADGRTILAACGHESGPAR